MNHARRVFVCLLGLVVILSILVFPVSAQGNDSGAAKSEDDYLLQSQKNLEMSLSILNTVATLIGVLIAIIALVVAILGGSGIIEIKKWRSIREDIEKYKIKIEKDSEVLRGIITKAEKDADKIRNEVKNIPQIISTEKPTDEALRQLDEFSRQLDAFELLGVSLKVNDYLNRGTNFYYKKNYEDALQAIDKAIELKPDYAMAWVAKGVVLNSMNRNDEALKACEKAIELEPDYVNGWRIKGVILYAMNRYDEALETYDKEIELKPDSAFAYFKRALSHSKMGNNDKVFSDLKKAIELDIFCKEMAKINEEFKDLWDNEEFKKLVK